PAGKHRLRLELLPEKAVESNGTHFEFRALLVAGGATPRPTRNVE
ncbi:MAG: hypothetical protein HN380_29325, partial [Victivallales bacterium]|nr:hypothetical protein [Victivallales bacterium]